MSKGEKSARVLAKEERRKPVLKFPPKSVSSVAPKPAAAPVTQAPQLGLDSKVNIFGLDAYHCRFPLWDGDSVPLSEKFFCGAIKIDGAVYCKHHLGITHNVRVSA